MGYYPPEIMRDAENIIRGLALHIDTVNKLADKERHLLDTTLDERRKLEYQEKTVLHTKFRLTWNLDLPAASEGQEVIRETETRNDRLCGQLRQKLEECRERERHLQEEKRKTELMGEQLMKLYAGLVDQYVCKGILERQGQ